MVETIAPVVHGGRNRSYTSAVALHALGATLAAGVLGALLGTIGALLGAPWGQEGTIAVVAIAAAYALRELAGLPVPLPDLDKQVPDWWRTFFSTDVAAFLYGAGLGVGFFTFLSFGTLVPVAAAALVSGEPAIAVLLLAPFGAARGLSVLVAATGKLSPEAVVDVFARTRTRRLGRTVNGIVLVALASILLLA